MSHSHLPVLSTDKAAGWHLQCGPVSLRRIEEAAMAVFDPLEFFPDCTPEALAQESAWLDRPAQRDPGSGRLVMMMQSFVLQSGGRTILVDTCVGNCKDRRRPAFHQLNSPWLDNLHALGLRREDVDLVLSTHLHVDHVGWHAMREGDRWVPTFPRARHLFVAEELAYFARPEARQILARNGDYWSDSIQPVIDAGLADTVASDHRIDAHLVLEPTPGDTPGHVALRIHDGDQDLALLTGDLFHHLLQIRHPDWSSAYSSDPDSARLHRHRVLERLADRPVCLIPAHFPAPHAGFVQRLNGGYGFRGVDGTDTFAG